MSSSFLKPSVTPDTALATRLRARPWYLPSSESSDTHFATSVPSACSNLMPAGNACFNLPFGPCTSTASGCTLMVTPFGTVMGFFPIRDMFFRLPDIAEHFAADARLDRFAAGHHAARGGQDAGAESGQHLRHIGAPEIDAAAGTADPLDAGDQPLAVRAVLEEQAQRPG